MVFKDGKTLDELDKICCKLLCSTMTHTWRTCMMMMGCSFTCPHHKTKYGFPSMEIRTNTANRNDSVNRLGIGSMISKQRESSVIWNVFMKPCLILLSLMSSLMAINLCLLCQSSKQDEMTKTFGVIPPSQEGGARVAYF